MIKKKSEAAQQASMSQSQIMEDVTCDYIVSLRNRPIRPLEAASEMLERTADRILEYNAQVKKERQIPVPKVLKHSQLAKLIMEYYDVALVSCAGKTGWEHGLLAVYQTGGPDKGIYSSKDDVIRNLVRKFYPQINSREIAEVVGYLNDCAPRKMQCTDRDLVAVNNGIFNYKTKQLLPFTPDLVFLTKCPVDYVAGAANPVLHNPDDGTDWDVESWMQEIGGTPDMAELIWQVIGAVIRPGVNWDKCAILHAEEGCNGKGSLCQLMRSLCGERNNADIPMQDFSKEFALEPLLHASAVIVDENNVGGFLAESANLKAAITGDTISVNRKFKEPVSYRFHGIIVQCLNELPKTKDKSSSLYRRMLFIPFKKCFTGKERKYIKHDYLGRREVLEYVLRRVLNMDYYELDEPAECRNAMAKFREDNEPVLAFWNELQDQFAWDLLPFGFLYDLYKAWHIRFNQGGALLGKRVFCRELRRVIENDPEWEATGNAAMNTGTKMDKPEYLIMEYSLREWMNPMAGPGTVNRAGICTPLKEKEYKGLYRVTPAGGTGAGGQP